MKNTPKKRWLRGASLFASAGIAETYFGDLGIDIVAANELLLDRANLYSALNPDSNMISGDLTHRKIFRNVLDAAGKIDFLIASPPCQGLSIAGKNRDLKKMLSDERNYLIFNIIDFIKAKKPNYVLIENVPAFLKLRLPFKGRLMSVLDILSSEFKSAYIIEAEVLNSADFGVPQRRLRTMIKLYKKGLRWPWPSKAKAVTVWQAISHLPSLEAGERSRIKWHYARSHSKQHVEWMRRTPTGHSAFENKKYYPKKENGEKIQGYMSTYRRIRWDEPSPTITMRNDAISSQRNVHPGRMLKNGTYSDARVLTPLELMLLSSLPANWKIPDHTPEVLIRKCIGECIPPLMVKKVVEGIG